MRWFYRAMAVILFYRAIAVILWIFSGVLFARAGYLIFVGGH